MLAGRFGREFTIVQARRRVAVHVSDELHQEHAVMKIKGLGNGHTGPCQAVQRVDLSALPSGLGGGTAKARAFGHGARLPSVLHFAVFGVVHRLAKAAMRGVLVDLGAAHLVTTSHDVHHRLFATHQLALHAVDQAFVDE